MRSLGVLFLLPALHAQYSLYTAATVSRGYVVGAKLPPSGLFRSRANQWEHIGFSHPFIQALDYDSRDPSLLYLAAGNGLIRAAEYGRVWTILTGADVTELRDLAVDRNAPGTIYFAHTAGIRRTRDGGSTWEPADSGIRRKYTEAIRVDRTRAGHLVAGTEDGLFSSADAGRSWTRAGASGFQVFHIEQAPHDPCLWLATTQRGGVFVSRDCAASFENLGRAGIDRNVYDVAFDPADDRRVALASWGDGVIVTEDGGKTWQLRNQGLPRPDVWSVAFDPAHPGRLYAGVHEEALYVSEDSGRTWRRDALAGSMIHRMLFIPERAR